MTELHSPQPGATRRPRAATPEPYSPEAPEVAAVFEVVCSDTRAIDREKWLDLRRQGMGSSDAGPALGLSHFSSAYSVACDKLGLLPASEESEHQYWGRAIEPVILDEYERRRPSQAPLLRWHMIRSLAEPWMLANPDGLAEDEVVEAKNYSEWDAPRWGAGVPDHIVIQCHHLMMVSGRPRATLCVLFGGSTYREFTVEKDEGLEESILAAERLFWDRVCDGNLPDPDGSEATRYALAEQYALANVGEPVALPPEAEELLLARKQAKADIRPLQEVVDTVDNQIRAWLGTANYGILDDHKVVTWSPVKPRRLTYAKEWQ